jgi:hypothetical protein
MALKSSNPFYIFCHYTISLLYLFMLACPPSLWIAWLFTFAYIISPFLLFSLPSCIRESALGACTLATGLGTRPLTYTKIMFHWGHARKWSEKLCLVHKVTKPSVSNIITYNPMISLCSGSLAKIYLSLVYIFLTTDLRNYSVNLILSSREQI